MKRKAGTAVLILTPFVMFGVFEWITGNLMEIALIYRILNLMLFFLLYFVVFAVTNSMGVGFSLLNVILTVWALAEHYVVEFRGRPIMIWDIMAFRTAMTVADTYQYDITLQVAAGVLVILLWTVLIWLFPVRLPSQKIWAGTAAGSLVCMAVFLFTFFQYGIAALGMEINMWYPSWSYAQYGYLLSTLRMVDYLSVDPPEGYSLAQVRGIQEEIQEWEKEDEPIWGTKSDTVPTNIICIMNESYSDLRVVGDFNVDEPTMIILFGDHQPSVEDTFYEALYGCSLEEAAGEDYLRRYITPFLVWTNYDTESMLEENLSAMFLSCTILERANLEITDFISFLRFLYRQCPVVHILGYYTSDMVWESWSHWEEKKEYPLFHWFDMLQYHNMFERNRITSLFQVSDG